jgi:hypothetical protein
MAAKLSPGLQRRRAEQHGERDRSQMPFAIFKQSLERKSPTTITANNASYKAWIVGSLRPSIASLS